MDDAALIEPRTYDNAQDTETKSQPHCEASEVAMLLMRAGVDHTSALWFQLLEVATQQACDWAERSAAWCAPLSVRAAALLGLRSLAADILSAAEPEEAARTAAEACLSVCAEIEARATQAPPRQRRWGEGAIPQPTPRHTPLQITAGCC